MDQPLRNKLWDIVSLHYWQPGASNLMEMRYSPDIDTYFAIYTDFWQRTADSVPRYTDSANSAIRDWYFEAGWNQVFDFLTFVLRECVPKSSMDLIVEQLNGVLERYLSAYRWVGNSFVAVVDDVQIDAIEEALTTPLAGVQAHLKKALRLLEDREHPDEENSIKESISAVESICSSIVGKKSTLGEALKKLTTSGVEIHPALERSWLSMYGYTSDEHGIRHAMQEESNLTVDDALFFLVSCSAFVSLLNHKALEAGIGLAPV